MRRPLDPVRLGERRSEPDEGIDQWKLVGDGGEAVVLDEGQREPAGARRVAVEKHPLPGDEDVVEHGQGLDHLVPRRDGSSPRVGVGVEEVGTEQLEARGRNWDGERHRPVLLALDERTGRDHDHLVDVRRARRVDLGSADDDPVRPAIDHPDVHVWIVLPRGPLRPIALDIGLRRREGQVSVTTVPEVLDHPLVGFGAMGNTLEREERVAADLLDEDHECVGEGGRQLDQAGPPTKVVTVPRQPVVGRVPLGDGEVAVRGLFREGEVESPVPGGDAELGVFDHVGDALAAVVDLPAVAKAVEILLRRPKCHRHSLLWSPSTRRSKKNAASSRLVSGPSARYHWYPQLQIPKIASVVSRGSTSRNSPAWIPRGDHLLDQPLVGISLDADRLLILRRELAIVLEEDPHVATVGVHQLEHVGHDLQQVLPGIAAGPRPLPLEQEVDELLVDPEEDLVLARDVVIEGRLADTDGVRERLDVRRVVAASVEEVRRLADELTSLDVRIDTACHGVILSTDRSVE